MIRQLSLFEAYNFVVSVPHQKGGVIVWDCVKDDIICEKDKYEAIGLHGFGCKLF